jgi:hypothetical protein
MFLVNQSPHLEHVLKTIDSWIRLCFLLTHFPHHDAIYTFPSFNLLSPNDPSDQIDPADFCEIEISHFRWDFRWPIIHMPPLQTLKSGHLDQLSVAVILCSLWRCWRPCLFLLLHSPPPHRGLVIGEAIVIPFRYILTWPSWPFIS